MLRRAAGLVLGSTIPLDEEHARAIARPTGAIVRRKTYDDAGRAVERWFAAKQEAHLVLRPRAAMREVL
jgi:hypothetical protein